jgi:hypothetical protein
MPPNQISYTVENGMIRALVQATNFVLSLYLMVDLLLITTPGTLVSLLENTPEECPVESSNQPALAETTESEDDCQPNGDFSLECDPFDPAKIFPGESSKTICTIKQ